MEEADIFMELWKKLSWRMAGAISLLVLCPVSVLLDIWSQKQHFGVNEELVLDPIILLVMGAIGVVGLILCGMQMSKYDLMKKERIRLEYGEQE